MTNPSQHLVDLYLARAMEEFDSNRLSARLIRRLADEFPALFLAAALEYLKSRQESAALRYLTAIALRQQAMFEQLTNPDGSRDDAINLFRRFQDLDPACDIKLAEKLPNRWETNLGEALDAPHSTRALDILDQASRGGRLLPMVSHLPSHHDPRISAKATLLVGRRVQNPSWTRKQLTQPDPRVRANAVEALWGLTSQAALQLLEDCVEDRSPRVSGNSLFGLHILGQSRAVQRVLYYADTGKYQFRSTAAWLLGRMGGPECIDRLTGLVKDEHPQVRSTALRSLIEIRRSAARSREAVVEKAAHADAAVVEKAVEEVAQVLNPGMSDEEFQLRLDGTVFRVR